MPDYILAYDLGTTGNKATLFDGDGGIVASALREYPTRYPRPGWAQQNADDWWRSTCEVTRDLLRDRAEPSAIAAIGFSGHMMGCLPVDANGAPLHDSLIHADARSEGICETLRQSIGERRLYQLTGNRIAPQYTLPKIGWLRAELPDVFARVALFLQAKDYLAFRFSGRLGVTDFSDASLSGLFDISSKRWCAELLAAVGIDESRLPEVLPAATVVGKVTAEAACATGLAEGTPVVIGGGDGACATVGAGALEPGDAYNYGGGTSWISMVTPQPLIDPHMRIFNLLDLDPTKANVLGTIQCAGSCYQWFAEEIGPGGAGGQAASAGNRFAALNALARSAPAGSDKLFFLPYLMGERAPIWDASARGVFFGLSLSHTRAHLTRAVLEGIAFALKSVCDVMEEQGGRFESLSVIGGMAAGDIFREILAAVLNKTLVLPSHPAEATSRGAAIAAAVAIGMLGSYRDARSWVRIEGEVRPNPELAALYSRYYDFWSRLYPALKDQFRQMVALG